MLKQQTEENYNNLKNKLYYSWIFFLLDFLYFIFITTNKDFLNIRVSLFSYSN